MTKTRITNTKIKHKGFVKEIRDNKLIVNIINESACSSCHAKGACTVADYQDKEIEITTYQNVYSPGQEVTVLFQESKGFAALFYGYLFPFIIVLLTLITASAFTKNELFSGLLSLGILIPYYITLYFFRHLLKKVFKFEVEETI
ncbi:MAG: SoxR reducing system RseC family protein [Prolixibacteraceae bacterium]|nr:SoxR reducing system RseC family protein [Prolixibacteraceae bacterium]